MNPAVYIAYPDMVVPIRRLPVYDYELGTEYVFDLEVVCTEAVDEARISCDQSGWLYLSSDAGASYDPIPATAQTGVDLGALVAGDRIAIEIKVDIPALTSVRRRFVAINIGIGV